MTRHPKHRRGNAALEVALWMPVLLLLISGMIQFGKITYTQYVLQKIVYTAARSLSVQQNVNFCDPADPATQAALTAALNDPATGNPLVLNLTSDMLTVTTRCFDSTGAISDCDVSGCDGLTGAQRPDFVTVAMPGGYTIPLRIPFVQLDPVQLRPSITVPFGGSKL
jgi:Flp pilus assembly protein TadG